jgi:hypothetical protein
MGVKEEPVESCVTDGTTENVPGSCKAKRTNIIGHNSNNPLNGIFNDTVFIHVE